MVPDRAFFQIFKITEKILLIQNIMDSFKSRPKNSKVQSLFNESICNNILNSFDSLKQLNWKKTCEIDWSEKLWKILRI